MLICLDTTYNAGTHDSANLISAPTVNYSGQLESEHAGFALTRIFGG